VTSSEKTSGGVIAAAIVGVLLSAVSLLFVVLFLIGISAGAANNVKGAGPAALAVAFVMMFVLFCAAIAGLVISVGLLFQKNWARLGALIWGGVGGAFSVVGTLLAALSLLQPMPRTADVIGRVLLLAIFAAGALIGIWWLVLFTRKSVIAQFVALEPVAIPADVKTVIEAESLIAPQPTLSPHTPDPFTILRGRTIIGHMLLSLLCTFVVMTAYMIFGFIVYGRSFQFDSPMLLAVIQVCLYGFVALSCFYLLRRSKLNKATILGSSIGWSHVRKYWLLPLFLPAVSIASYYAIFWPLSFAMPRFIGWYLFDTDETRMIATTGSLYPIANLITLFSVVVAAPVIEEFVFRGLLLTRWAIKWGTPRAILATSILFGILHKEFLGHIFFGFVMAVLYIETKSLFAPILVHAANNALAYSGLLAGTFATSPHETLSTFQAQRGTALTLGVIFIPLALLFLWRHFPKAGWTMPYEASRVSDPLPAESISTAVAEQ
jgi:membrane protease YdiL (CAAX protease family)